MVESFFQRWSRRKAEHMEEPRSIKFPSAEEGEQKEAARSGQEYWLPDSVEGKTFPTMADVVKLNSESDYSLFVKKEVDQTVRRAALKKLFSDPHFNLMDGLDIYIDDYTKPSPLPPAMLAALSHTKNLFGPVSASEEVQESSVKDSSDESIYPDESRDAGALGNHDSESAADYAEEANAENHQAGKDLQLAEKDTAAGKSEDSCNSSRNPT